MFDYEGARVVLPTSPQPTLIPSSQFQNATLAHLLSNGQSGEIPFHQQLLKVFNGATVGGASWDFSQGRRVWQYQILDDFSKVRARIHFARDSVWLHDNVTELGFGEELNGWLTINSLMDFYNGSGADSTFAQRFPSATEQPFRCNTFGGYVADDWKARQNLTISLNLRLESYANPTCDHNCFARLSYVFTGAPENVDQPYNQAISFNQHDAYPNTQAIVWEPRVGIAWSPGGSNSKTVIRTGAGIFADEIAGQYAQYAAFNAPELLGFTVSGATLPSGVGAFAPGVAGSLVTAASNANWAFRNGFASGATLASLMASTPGFVPPNMFNFPSNFLQPTYCK